MSSEWFRNTFNRQRMPGETEARGMLEGHLAKYAVAIRVMRRYHQFNEIESMDFTARDEDLERWVEQLSRGNLASRWSNLCAIDTRQNAFLDHQGYKDLSPQEMDGYIKGFTFLIRDRRVVFEVLAVDEGVSQQVFYQMNSNDRRQLLRLFGERRRDSLVMDRKSLSPIYVAAVTEVGLGSYNIEEMVQSTPTGALFWERN